MMINIDKIYDLMADKGFQEPRTGNLFFPAYIYTYPPEQEYAIREQINMLIQKLQRPNHYLDSLVINIYEELMAYFKNESFAGKSLFELIIEKEKEDAAEALAWVKEEINQGDFFKKFESKIKEHFAADHERKVYLIIYGFGSSFPFLRASDLLKKTERLIKEFKVIVFYPGEYRDSKYSLFNILNDDNMYRANNLNKQLGEFTE